MRMRHPYRALIGAALLAACGGARVTPATLPAPMLPPAPAPAKSSKFDAAPPGWQRMDYATDSVMGVGSDRAIRELLAGKVPRRRVVVAVIDGGVDTSEALLRPNLWTNAAGLHGWNFVGGPNGSINKETLEVTRVYAACHGYAAGTGIAKPDAAMCAKASADFAKKRTDVTTTYAQVMSISKVYDQVTATLRRDLGSPSLTKSSVTAYKPAAPADSGARRIWLQLAGAGIDSMQLAEARNSYGPQATVGLDTVYYSRGLFGDTSAAVRASRRWGNRDVTGPDPLHGTHVAGIIAATLDSVSKGLGGIAPFASIMSVRTVPNGDERDEDVAAAIRFAADNGANILNMSFGKPYSPGKAMVDSAVRYAASIGVLMVHAAGNDGEDTDSIPEYPNPKLLDGSRAANWIEVGASSWNGLPELAAPFTDYGRQTVDLFAPGVDILSTLPGGTSGMESGTSMSAPVVSGVAALLMAYFPDLTAADVRALILRT
ncbi:MAG: S8 family serine peptidase, partial [Gemmatimonadaceae bacterium]